jgi:hypothetical protein
MHRLMEENRQVSAAKIKALSSEVEELRPMNVQLRAEIDTLRRHLALAVGELKNPIVLPPARDLGTPDFERDDWMEGDAKAQSDAEGSEYGSDSGFDEGDQHDELARELHDEAQAFLNDLGMFRRKVGTDVDRFVNRGDLMHATGYDQGGH